MITCLIFLKGVEERISSDGAAVISPTDVGGSGSCGSGSGLPLPRFPGSSSSSTLGALLNTSTDSSRSSLILPWNGHNTNTNHHNIGTSSNEAATLVAVALNNSTNSFGSGSSPGSGKGAGNKHGHNSRGDTSTHTNGEHHDTTCIPANLGESSNIRYRGSKGSSHALANGLSNSLNGGNPIANGSSSQNSTLGEVDYMEKMKEEASGHSDHSSKSSNGILPGLNNINSSTSNASGSNKSNKPSSTSGSAPRDASRKNRGDDRSSGNKGSAKDVDPTVKMETDLKKLKVDLQISRNKENDLRDQIISYMSSKFRLSILFCNLV